MDGSHDVIVHLESEGVLSVMEPLRHDVARGVHPGLQGAVGVEDHVHDVVVVVLHDDGSDDQVVVGQASVLPPVTEGTEDKKKKKKKDR